MFEVHLIILGPCSMLSMFDEDLIPDPVVYCPCLCKTSYLTRLTEVGMRFAWTWMRYSIVSFQAKCHRYSCLYSYGQSSGDVH